MIQVTKVSKKIGSFQLQNLNFEIPKGYICGLVGENGSGKTTLLHLLLGLYKADEGEVMIQGMQYPKQEKALHDMIGTVLNEDMFYTNATVKYNAQFYGKYYTNYDDTEMKKLCDRFQLDENVKYGKLSKGQKLKAQYAFALACHPKLLILDEPTGNFDPDFREYFLKSIQDFISDGDRSVILASHITDDLDRLADYLIYLKDGKLFFSGDMENFRNQYRVVSGEEYKLKLIDPKKVIATEAREFTTKALVLHGDYEKYDETLTITYPTIEDVMYFYSKREEKRV